MQVVLYKVHVPKNRFKLWVFVNMVMSLQVPQKAKDFLSTVKTPAFGHSDDGANNNTTTVMRSALCALIKCS